MSRQIKKVNISGKEDKSNKVTGLLSNSNTDTEYPSAKSVVDTLDDFNSYVIESFATKSLLNDKENIINKSSSITTDTGSTSKYPTVKAVEDYAQPKGNYLTQHQSLANYVQKSDTNGLLKNDGSVDTTQYLSSLPSHNHDDRYYTESEVDTALNGKANSSHTHSQYLTEHQDLSNYVTTDDSRLSDARTPTSHTHTKSQITDFPTIPSASSTVPSADTTNGSYGSGTSYARSNHTHPKSSLYAEASHTHSQYLTSHQDISGKANINDLGAVALSNDYDDLDNKPTIPTSTSQLTNDSGFLTSHQDISGKEDSSNKVSSWNSTTNNIRYPTEKLVKDSLDGKSDNGHTHSQYLTSHQDISGKENTSNKVTSISSSSTDTQYPSAKCVYDENNDLWNYVESLDYTQIRGELTVVDEGIQAQGLEQIINQIISRLTAKSNTNHTHSEYASSSHTHSTWSSTSITNGTLYYNSAIRLCSLRYSRTFNSASANTLYEWGQLIPSGYRPKYMISGSGNRNGASITIDSDGYVYGRFAIAFSSSTDFYYHIMWHY